MARKNSLQAQIEARVAERSDAVYLTREFSDLGAKRQVLRALANSVAAGRLVRLGYGVYGPATQSRLTGKPMLANPGGFMVAARHAGLGRDPGRPALGAEFSAAADDEGAGGVYRALSPRRAGPCGPASGGRWR